MKNTLILVRRGIQANAEIIRQIRARYATLEARVEKLEIMPAPAVPSAARLTVLTIDDFCKRNGLSRRTFFNLRAAGEGPAIMKVGGAIRITFKSEKAWRRRMEIAAPRKL